MTNKKQDLIDQRLQDLNNDGVDRRGFLKCMAWAGTGLVWTMSGGIPASRAFAKIYGKDASKGGDFSFVQISDSHIGFNKPAAWGPSVTNNWSGLRQISRDVLPALRLCSSRTFLCGPSIPIGAGEPTTVSAPCLT